MEHPFVAHPGPVDWSILVLTDTLLVVFALFALALVCLFFWISWLLYDALRRLPPQFRETEPWTAWLLLIPMFSLIWNFIIYTRTARSYRAYYNARGITDVGDCGERNGAQLAIASVISAIPCIGSLAWVLALVYAIRYFRNLGKLKRRLTLQIR